MVHSSHPVLSHQAAGVVMKAPDRGFIIAVGGSTSSSDNAMLVVALRLAC